MRWRVSYNRAPAMEGSFILTISYALDKVREGSRDDEAQAFIANKIARKELDKRCISYADYKEWRKKNSFIFTTVVDEFENLIGFFDVFPLTEEAGKSIIDGTLTERSLRIEHILPMNEISSATHVHVATIIVNPRQRSFSKLVANELVTIKMAQFMERTYAPANTRIFTAYGQSKAGEALLRRSGFTPELLASENDQKCPLYVLRPEKAEGAVLRFDLVENGLAAMRGKQDDLKTLDQRIEAIELGLRELISAVLEADPTRLPPHVNQKADERLKAAAKKHGSIIDVARYALLPHRLEFCDLRELGDTITSKALWTNFSPLFANKETFVARFDQVTELRNGIRHSRFIDQIVRKEGEAGILWFERILLAQVSTA